MNKLQGIFNTTDDSNTGYFIEVDLRYPDIIKEKSKNFSLCPEKKNIHTDKYKDSEYMKQIKPKNYTKSKKLL